MHRQHLPMKSLLCLFSFGFIIASAAFCQNRYVASSLMKTNYFLIQHKRSLPTTSSLNTVRGKLFAEMVSKLRRDGNNTDPSFNSASRCVPYVIQKIGRGNKREINELSRLCVDVFFNDQTYAGSNDIIRPPQQMTPWKAAQLAYLRNAQAGDILTRNAFKKDQRVDIIVARQVHNSCDYSDVKEVKFVQGGEQVYNREKLSTPDDPTTLVLGDIIGYCEVIEKNFGLGEKLSSGKAVPYLANLSVSRFARQSGVGSKLLDASEEIVREWKAGYKTMVLQVEQDNIDAIQFYKKRGWKFVYADPTCRRFDTSGFFLKESRVTKYAMVRDISNNHYDDDNSISDENIGSKFSTRRIKKMWFVSQ